MKKQFLIKFSVAAFFCLLCVLPASAANIKIKGAVKDKLSKEPLIGATIRLIGTQTGAVTDMDGNFELNDRGLLEGMYDVEIKYIGYKTEVRRKVRVENGKLVILNLELETDAQELSDVVVVAKKNRENENMLLLEQQKAVIAVQSVSVKELSRKGVSDAEGAVTKVSGVSKQDGVKNVFVRGLGDRYNATTFNGFSLPSEDPEYKNISLDFFGTDVIQSVGANKAFHAGGSSDVGGATIDIVSKELIGSGNLGFGISGGLNTQTLTADFLKMDGVNFMGFSNRTEPADENTWGFKNKLDPSEKHLQINRSYSISGGKRFYVGKDKNPLSFFLTAGHTTDYQYTDEVIRNTTTSGTVYKDMQGKKYAENISQLALANVDYDMNNRHHVSYNFMMVHANTQSVGDYNGKNSIFSDDYENLGLTRRQQSNDNLLIVNQLMTNWGLTKSLSLDAGASYNIVKGYEPDRRINNITKAENGYTLLRGNSQQRYFSSLNEDDINVKAGLVYRLKDDVEEISNIRLGYTGRFVDDNFKATEYNLTVGHASDFPSLDGFSLDDYYNQENFSSDWFKIQKNVDKYTVKKNIHSAYAEATYQFTSHWIANLGLKYDNVDINVDYNVNRGGSEGSNTIRKDYFLPSLNLKYNLNEKHSLRLGASKTYTLPQAKEISPYRYVGVNFNSQGNPDLKPSDNYNLDLKWDFNPSPSELISLTAFYKHIKDPISRIEVASAGGYLSYENIADKATVAGVEVEIRKNLFVRPVGSAANGMNKLSFGLNGSYIYTNAKMPLATITTGSQLEGAAPWIANFDLSHNFTRGERSFINTLVLNYVSDKIYTIGTQGYQDIMERGCVTLDFVSQARLNKHVSLNLKARNLLNPSYKLSRKANEGGEKIVLGDYKKGINISLGVACTF
ncbi:TonB-dependent receptor [Bacteroides faecium]|uniref:TonB-dependent receptor n=1 Tax=Bacteroides faecium TaxID=2715212 RepID=A0A6H0KMM6_9BACE|nr:TonB-dependent receptor [Bacteroides faecium]QIU94459.1 TonB-dependent receptor [Bacteroides faecium]